MTREEAIDFLKSEKEATRELATACNSDKIDYFKKHEEAYDMAINSLEAWEKVKDEIKNYDNFIICANGQTGIHIDKVLEIIDKYSEEKR